MNESLWMTPVSQLELLSLSLYGFLLGIVLAFLFDIFRFFRIFRKEASWKKRGKKESKVKLVLIFFEDVLYGMIASAVTAVVLFNINNGVPRWFILLGAALGFFAYRVTLGNAVMRLNTAVAKITVKIVFFIYSNTVLRMSTAVKKAVCKIIADSRKRRIIKNSSRLEEEALNELKNLFVLKIENV